LCGVPPGGCDQRPRLVEHGTVDSIEWTWFLILASWRTTCVRRPISRRLRLARSSGSHTGGRKSAAGSCARIRAPTLSVFTLASAIALV
jgi:hypothetical protein